MERSFWGPVGASFLAGGATTVGGLVVFVLRGTPNPRTVAFFVAFAAGVMGVVSVVDLWLPSVIASFASAFYSTAFVLAGFLGSVALKHLDLPGADQLLSPLLTLASSGQPTRPPQVVSQTASSNLRPDVESGFTSPGSKLSPSPSSTWESVSPSHRQRGSDIITSAAGVTEKPEAVSQLADRDAESEEQSQANVAKGSRASSLRLGALVCVALTAHNLPEGLGVMAAGTKSQHLGIVVAAALALHNIAEGFCVAVPIWAGTGSRWLALGLTAASGMSEPVGALLGALVLRHWVAPDALDAVLNGVLCAVAGVMLNVAAMELIPEALALVRGDVAYVAKCAAAGGGLILAALMLI